MNKEFKNRIYNYEVKPPLTTWGKIAGNLDDIVPAQFPEKLFELEIAPPPRTWEKIANELDQETLPAYILKLQSYEALPPANAWNKIANELDNEIGAQVINMPRKKPNTIWRYAVAAAIIGLIAFSALWFSTGNDTSSENIATNSQPANLPANTHDESNDISAEKYPDNSYQETQDDNTTQSWVAEENYRRQYPTQSYYTAISSKNIRNSPVQLATSFSIDDLADNIQTSDYREISYNPSHIAEDNPYVLVLHSDGSVVRISKKLSSMINCLNTEPTLNDIECRQMVDQWRRQIAQSPITPSPDNFLDMLDLINSIKENTP